MTWDERDRLKQARSIYRRIGFNLEFFTDRRLQLDPIWHANAAALDRARRMTPSADGLAAVVHHLERTQVSSLRACALAMSDPDLGEARVMALAIRRIVQLEMDLPIGPDAEVKLKPGYRDRVRLMRPL